MRVANAIGGVTPAPGTLYVASSQQQLTFTRAGRFAYANEQANRADTLFRSAAAAYGERVIAVVLTGRLDDGALGVVAVKNAGGRAFAQDRASAAAFSMPGAAIATGCVDYVLPPAAIAAALITLTMLPEAAELFAVSSPPWALSAA
jgi:two-component system chemotaxis response regulator CheB